MCMCYKKLLLVQVIMRLTPKKKAATQNERRKVLQERINDSDNEIEIIRIPNERVVFKSLDL